MSMTSADRQPAKLIGSFLTWGVFWLFLAVLGAAVFFQDGLNALLRACNRRNTATAR